MFYHPEELKQLIGEELKTSFVHNPAFHSYHEGYAVIREELEEASEAMGGIWPYLKVMWEKDVRGSDYNGGPGAEERLDLLCQRAEDFAKEAIQVAAMMRKLRMSRDNNWETPDPLPDLCSESEGAGGHWECPCDGCESESECDHKCEWANDQDAPCTRQKWVPDNTGDSCDS